MTFQQDMGDFRSPSDSVTIMYENNAFFLVVVPKGTHPNDAKRLVVGDLDMLVLFLQGFFKPVERVEINVTPTETAATSSIGFMSTPVQEVKKAA